MNEPVKIYIPLETTALSLDADEVTVAIFDEATDRGLELEIIRNGSRGMSWLEPLVEVETAKGRVAYGPVTAEEVKGLFEAGFLDGGEHALKQGLTEEIPYLKKQERLTFARVGLIDPLNLEDYRSNGGFAGLQKALSMAPADIVREVTESGLRGRGGAAFPAGIKWNTVLNAPADQKYITCNADEGDSGTFADRLLMEGDPFCLLEGMTIAGLAVGATKGYIYLRSEYPLCHEILNEALQVLREAGYLGADIQGSGKSFDVEVRKGAGAYICGEETSMLESLEGKKGMVRAKPPLPAIEGLFGKPTVVNNVITLASVPYILSNGGKTYADFGMGRSRGTMTFQLAGNIRQGGLVEKAFGVTLRELMEEFGGGTHSGRPARAVQVGGPLGAYLPEQQFDLPMDYESFAAEGAMVGHGGIVVFDDTVDMAEQARFAFEFCKIESCGKCTPCRIGSVRGMETLEKVIRGEHATQNLQLTEDLCEVMEDGSLCAMGGMTPYPVKSAMKYFPEDFRSHDTQAE
ncbi:NADH-quinone oxidoreductase subunit NuoF [Emcibacter sp.]|uniref:formate dehydrogenase beta subunit n=1 Tax=Emcibacter sp. TaxID=1979954 RepID=UPI002AA648CA|nr:NADH-quinone oxidoreductase subunit NuoF [Emcibacter sp.]